MEILNNIWMAVSTPNESLINIIAIPAVIIENFLIMSLFISILHISANRYKKIAYVLTLSAIGIFTMYFIPNPFNIFINYFASVAIAYFVFKNSLLKTTISAIIALTIFNLIGILILNPYLTIFHIETSTLNTIFIYRLLYISIMYLFTGLIIFFINNINLKIESPENIDRKNKLIIFSNLFFGILAIIIQSITLFYYVDTLPNIITFLSFISLLAYFAISIYSFNKSIQIDFNNKKVRKC